jgi:3-deoxy-manno-octulosonate cytidylyltransferase (CMP-KDO synthetase)
MLQHVWERASESRYLTSIIVATDDERIRDAARGFGARVMMTSTDHASGTDRVAEVASANEAHWVVNVQGDEPTLDPTAIDAAILGMMDQEEAQLAFMGTLKTRITRPEAVQDPNVVKVVTDHHGNAIYFSRSPIPYIRQADESATHYKHIGLYIYQRDFLLAYSTLPVGPLEQAERLEQLRALENGFRIRVIETEYDALGVDTPEDWQHVAELFEKTALMKE